MMKDVITVECQKINGKLFIGTVNYSEAKIKIFQDGLGLDVGLLESVKINLQAKIKNQCLFKYKKNQHFDIARIYHSKGILTTDSIKCKELGVDQII